MVLYFSATGNTRYVAEQLAERLKDQLMDLGPRIKGKDYRDIHSDSPFVLCAPTYVSAPPVFFTEFIRRVEFTGNREVYYVSTSGGYSGISGVIVGRIIRRKGMAYRGWAEFKMPPNYIANKPHRLPEPSVIRQLITKSAQQAGSVSEAIQEGRKLKSRHIWLLEYLVDYLLGPPLCRIGHRVDGFVATDRCTSCGLCERKCPMNIIGLHEGRPVWSGKTCAHCMACIQNCPVEAIEFGNVTQGRKRYRLKEYTLSGISNEKQ
jgi:NAD-dependent dihydropyrimidine dehydrogenase PreA subunit